MAKAGKRSSKQQSEWICVLELDQAAGPRRNPNLARLWVKRVRTRPGLDLDKKIKTSARWQKKALCACDTT